MYRRGVQWTFAAKRPGNVAARASAETMPRGARGGAKCGQRVLRIWSMTVSTQPRKIAGE